MPRNEALERVLKTILILENNRRGLTVKEMHERIAGFFEVDERTTRRDLEILVDANMGIETDESRADDGRKVTRYLLKRGDVAVGKSLTIPISELLALFYARGMLKPLRDTVFYQDLEKFFRKIEALFDKKTLEYLGEVSESVHFEAGPRWALGLDPETLETVRSACEEGHQLQVFYQGHQL